MCTRKRSEIMDALRKPKEMPVRIVKQDLKLRASTLECKIEINGFTVPATVDSGAATSIIAREAMEQLGFDVEEATNCTIISANGQKDESLGRIKTFPLMLEET